MGNTIWAGQVRIWDKPYGVVGRRLFEQKKRQWKVGDKIFKAVTVTDIYHPNKTTRNGIYFNVDKNVACSQIKNGCEVKQWRDGVNIWTGQIKFGSTVATVEGCLDERSSSGRSVTSLLQIRKNVSLNNVNPKKMRIFKILL